MRKNSSYGYANDYALFSSATSFIQLHAKLQAALDNALARGREHGITFDFEKSELQYCPRNIKE